MNGEKGPSVLGEQLWRLLPEEYRKRDRERESREPGDLQKYLDACGSLLDLIHRALLQRLADSFPDGYEGVGAPQSWLLPYFADLFDARLVAPTAEGRAEEVGSAIAWRQRKGTIACIDSVAQGVGRLNVEVQEGWGRVACTPRVGVPFLPSAAYGETSDSESVSSLTRARHPGLPAATLDFRLVSRAVALARAEEAHPLARTRESAAGKTTWVQIHPRGVPGFPDSYEDVSPRTPDMRTPDWAHGHYHPKRITLHVPPPYGFFAPGWEESPATTKGDLTLGYPKGHIQGEDLVHRLQDRIINGTLTVTAGRVELVRCAVRKIVVTAPDETGVAGQLLQPALYARDCLFDRVEVTPATGQGFASTARLEYCTVLTELIADRLRASDSVFAGSMQLTKLSTEVPSCIRYSRVPGGLPDRGSGKLGDYGNTTDVPVFHQLETLVGGSLAEHGGQFGEPGCGVFHPSTPGSICFGAEDRGEMGAYHREHHCLRRAAVIEKLRDFLPLGLEALWVPDARLLVSPPGETLINSFSVPNQQGRRAARSTAAKESS